MGWGLFQGGASTSNTQQFCTINLKFVTGFHVPGKVFSTLGKQLQQFFRKVAVTPFGNCCVPIFLCKTLKIEFYDVHLKIACESKYDPGSVNKQIL